MHSVDDCSDEAEADFRNGRTTGGFVGLASKTAADATTAVAANAVATSAIATTHGVRPARRAGPPAGLAARAAASTPEARLAVAISRVVLQAHSNV